ncbi:Zn(2)-C6 fungal-type DNA-binding domain protein [Metarhizium album ARSEF 1941]|uniref:Zn(2)-C6 fungal-type DNA-binding domain protein n=1 Tax=Metarhizium album (strain ARSEF 1941) TaxID=1081103 RepID=A0A0B2X063_METAS|nr:Zn(2)-C6 fungal-type DNA-binding domain protein [Metarhizium album ARSEF 1941]KHN99683.1 Zn(2)-C6 fungal-type DNA-binding domain protein [Metarhizium album ARSEF 1941]
MAASLAPHTSPHASPFDFENTDDESWQYLDDSSGASAAGSVGFLPSPASGSLNGYAIVGHTQANLTPPPQASLSPLSFVDMDQAMFLPASTSFAGQEGLGTSGGAARLVQGSEDTSGSGSGSGSLLTPHEYLFADGGLSQQDMMNGESCQPTYMAPFMSSFLTSGQTTTTADFTSSLFQADPAMTPWNATSPTTMADDHIFSFGELVPSSNNTSTSNSITSAAPPPPGSSPKSPGIKADFSKSPMSAVRKVKDAKIEKKTQKPAGSQSGKFFIMTPTSMTAHAGRPNPFECFEAMRATQRGRKGPLADETKENALQVRRLGACFCCHSRKVKCDKERPCKHCKRLILQIPQVVCWQFHDFIPVLFPEFIRAHFKKDEMAKFLRDNVDGPVADGVPQPCEVELFCGPRFSAVLSVKAVLFTPKSRDVLQHWHTVPHRGSQSLQANGSAPIGLEFNTAAQRDDVRKKVKAYVADLVNEPFYAEQVTDSVTWTQLPVKILRIVQTYAKQSDSPMVRRALSIYAMHYIMTRHLCITPRSVVALGPSLGPVCRNAPFVTSRVLARQIKSLVDELILREMQVVFELFSKSLKPKHRREWAPCAAAFLVLCLFMEAVETTADNFVTCQNEIHRRNASPAEYRLGFALDICKELENMPFKQFAYQFHNIYQTHAKDANTKSFNPLFDENFEAQGELDGPAVEMVRSMRDLFAGEAWQDMQFLADDEIILSRGESTHSTDGSFLYTGRLVAKFLLSFTDENAIFGGKI